MSFLDPDARPDGDPAAPAWVTEPLVDVRSPLDIAGSATVSTATRERREFSARLAVDLAAGDLFDDLVLAVYEALANTVDHAYRDAPEPGPVRVFACRFDDAIRVTVTDHGDWRDGDDTADTARARSRPRPTLDQGDDPRRVPRTWAGRNDRAPARPLTTANRSEPHS